MSDTTAPAPPSASAEMAAAAAAVTTVTDASGRRITYRRLGILQQAKIFKAIGPAQSENGPYVRLATMAAAVTSIDDVPAPPLPTNDREVEAAITRLGDDGFVAVSLEMTRRAEEALEAAKAAAAAAKN